MPLFLYIWNVRMYSNIMDHPGKDVRPDLIVSHVLVSACFLMRKTPCDGLHILLLSKPLTLMKDDEMRAYSLLFGALNLHGSRVRPHFTDAAGTSGLNPARS